MPLRAHAAEGVVKETTIRLALRDDLGGVMDLYRHLNPDDPPLEAAAAEAA